MGTPLDALIFGIRKLMNSLVLLPQRDTINFGSGLLATDDPVNGVTTVTATGGGGASPAGVNGDLQMKNGAALAASALNDNGATITATRPLVAGSYITVNVSGGPAYTGAIRWDSAAAQAGLFFRGSAGVSDIPVLNADASDNLYVGTTNAYSTQAPTINAYATAAVGLGLGGVTYLYVNGIYVQMWMPAFFKDGSAPASPGGGGVMTSVLGLPYWCDNNGFVHQLAEYRVCLNANFVSAASITLQGTNLSFPVVAGDVWEIEFQGWMSQASGVAGAAMGLVAGGGAAFTQEGVVEGTTSGLTAYVAAEMTASGTGYGVFNTLAATKGHVWGKTTVTVTTGGTIALGVKPIAAVAATLYAGYSLTAKRIKKV